MVFQSVYISRSIHILEINAAYVSPLSLIQWQWYVIKTDKMVVLFLSFVADVLLALQDI